MRIFLGVFASVILLTSVSVCMMPVSADNTVPSKEVKVKVKNEKEEKMPKHAKSNMEYKLSLKNKSMSIKASAGIQTDLPDAKKSNEKTKFKTTYSTKILTKSKGTKHKEIGIKTNQFLQKRS